MAKKDIDKIYLDLKKESPDLDDDEVLEKTSKLYEMQNEEDTEDYSSYGEMGKYMYHQDGVGYFDLNDYFNDLLGTQSSTIYDVNDAQVEVIRKAIQYPVAQAKTLVKASKKVYDLSQDYKTAVKILGNLLRYVPMMNPRNDSVTKDDFIEQLKFIESFNYKFSFENATKKSLVEDVYYGYVVSNRGSSVREIMDMPPEYCHIAGKDKFGCYYYYFDITYFDTYPEDLEFYPNEFKIKYDSYLRKKKKRLNPSTYMLPRLKNQMCVKFDIVKNYALPYFSSSLIEMIRLDEIKEQHFSDSLSENFKLIHQKIPIDTKSNKKDKFLISGNISKSNHANLKKNAGNNANVVTTPMDLSAISLKNSAQQLTNTPDYNFSNLYSSIGISQLLANNDKAGSTGIKANLMINSAMMFTLLRQYENFFNKQLFYHTQSLNYKVTMLNLTENNWEEMYTKYKSQADSGYNKFYAPACLQQTQLDIIYGMDMERNKLNLVDDYLDKPLISSHLGQQKLNINDDDDGQDDGQSDESIRAEDRE